jgi:hypothetical protein
MYRIWAIALTMMFAFEGSATHLLAQDSSAQECTARLTTFVGELDDLLRQRPHDLTVVTGFLHHHFPVRNCTVDVASNVMKASAYFKGEERVKRSIQFSFSNSTASSRGATILLVLHDTGDWDPPFAIWYPPYP